MSDLQNWKRIARRCFQPEKDEKIRWTSDPGVFFHSRLLKPNCKHPHQKHNVIHTSGVVQVCVDKHEDRWIIVSLADYARFVHTELAEAIQIKRKLGAGLFTPKDLANIKEPPAVAVGHGMMTLNNVMELDDVVLPLPAAEVLLSFGWQE
jgi:hypothetical protein